MESHKIKRLEGIRNEIGELHPLLHSLLPKLPGVLNVEYTHGQDEMGADFVISKRDETFRESEYVGVIAKIGKIVQDFSDIERQIDECAIPRTYLGGKVKVRLQEIWVICTSTITKGAQEKIHEKYSARKIIFIDGSRLSRLIDDHIPFFWTDVSIEAGEYLAALHSRNEEADRALSLIQIGNQSFYVEQDLVEVPRLEQRISMRKNQAKPRKVTIEEIIDQKKLVLVEGAMGSGKSKLIRRIVEQFTNPEVFLERKVLPIPVSFAELQDIYSGDLSKLIEKKVPTDLREHNDDISYLILIDGIDEKNLPHEDQIPLLGALAEQVKSAGSLRVVVTSRYLSGLDETSELENDLVRYQLPPLGFAKTLEFLKRLCAKLNISTRLIEDLRKSQLFKELPHSPIAAILLAKLLNENPKDLPSNMTELYSQYSELMLGRWDVNKGLQTLKEYQVMEHILMQISEKLLDYEMSSMTITDARTIAKEYLAARNLELNGDELFDKMLQRCEMLLVDHDRDSLGFKHRTFAEFFYAKTLRKSGKLNLPDRAFRLYWMNTVFFYLGLIKDCPEQLNSIIDLPPASEPERWLKIVNMSNYFLAGYASPYEIITKGVVKVMLDAAALFKEIAEGKINSPFSFLPHIHILFLLQFLIREGYSYTFFKTAIEDAALSIEDGDYPTDIKLYSLFFLNVAYIELSGNESFDFLLERHIEELPTDISLMIKIEAKHFRHSSALLKKQERRFRKQLKGNRLLQTRIRKLFEEPIRKPQKEKKTIE